MKKIKRKDYTFAEVVKIGTEYHKDTNFCSVVAVCLGARVSFGKAHNWMRQHGRVNRRGAYDSQYHAVMKKLGCNLERVDCVGLPSTVGATARVLNRGTYLVQIRRHVLIIRDGDVMDWTGNKSRHRVRSIHRITIENKA